MAEINGVGELPTSPPGLVTTDPGVYSVVKREAQGSSPAGFIFVYIGTVPLGTPADPNQTVNGKYVVPANLVSWAGSARTVVPVGTC